MSNPWLRQGMSCSAQATIHFEENSRPVIKPTSPLCKKILDNHFHYFSPNSYCFVAGF